MPALNIAIRITGESASLVTAAKTGSTAVNELSQAAQQSKTEFSNYAKGMTSLSDTLNGLSQEAKSAKGFTELLNNSFVNSVKSAGQFAFSVQNLALSFNQLLSPFKSFLSVGTNFESKMVAVGATADTTAEGMQELTEGVRKLAKDSVFTADEVATAVLDLARAGFTSKEILQTLPGVINLGAASGEHLGTVSAIASSQLRSFGLETKKMTQIADLFTKAANTSNVSVADLGESMKYSSPIFQTIHQSIETLTAATGMLGNFGMAASQTGTTLRMAMLRVAIQPRRAREGLEDLGVKVSEVGGDVGKFAKEVENAQQKFDAMGIATKLAARKTLTAFADIDDYNTKKSTGGKFRDFADILIDLNKATQGLGDEQKLKTLGGIFGAEASSGMLKLVEQSKEFQKTTIENGKAITITTTAFKEYRKTISDNAGFAEQTARRMLDALKGDWLYFTGNLEEVGLSIFAIVGPALRYVVQQGTKGLGVLNNVIQSTQSVLNAFWEGFLIGFEPVKYLFDIISAIATPILNSFNTLFVAMGKLLGIGNDGVAVFDKLKSAASTFGLVAGLLTPLAIIPLTAGIKGLANLAVSVAAAMVRPFATAFQQIATNSKLAFKDLKDEVNQAKFTGSAFDPNQKSIYLTKAGTPGLNSPGITERVKQLASSRSVNQFEDLGTMPISQAIKYNKNPSLPLPETEQFKQLKTVAAKEAMATRSIMQELVVYSTKQTEKIQGVFGRLLTAFSAHTKNIASQTATTTKTFLNEAAWTGSAYTHPAMQAATQATTPITALKHTQPVLDRTSLLAGEQGIQQYLASSKKETQAFKDIKDKVAKQALETRNTWQKLGLSIVSTWNKLDQASNKISETISKSLTSSVPSNFGSKLKGVFGRLLTAFSAHTKNIASQTATTTKTFLNEAAWTGSAYTHPAMQAATQATTPITALKHTQPVLDRTSLLAGEQGIQQYLASSKKETQAFKDIKDKVAKQALETRTTWQKLGLSIVTTWNKLDQASNKISETISKSLTSSVPSNFGSKLNGAFGKKSLLIGGILAGTVAATAALAPRESVASEMPAVDKNKMQTNLAAGFSLTRIKEQWSKDFSAMLDRFGLLKPATTAITAILANLETVGMGAFMLLTSGLVSLGAAFTTVTGAGAALGAFFVGWQIGTYIYNQFGIVQEAAITVVGAFVETGKKIGEVFTNLTTIDYSALGQSLWNSLTNVFTTGIPQLTQTLNNMWSGLGDVFMAPAKLIGDLTTTIGTTIGTVTAAVSQGNWGDAGLAIIQGIGQGILAVGSFLTDTVVGVIKMAVSAIIPDTWYQAGATLLITLGQGITSVGHVLLDSVNTSFQAVWGYLGSLNFTESGQFLLTTLVTGITTEGQSLCNAVGGVITTAKDWVTTVNWSEQGINLLATFATAFTPNIVVSAVTGVIQEGQNYLATINWGDEGTGLITKMGTAITAAGGLLVESFKGAIEGIFTYLTTIDFTESGKKMLTTIGTGIQQGAADLTKSVSDSLTSVRQYLPFSDAKTGPLSDLTASGKSIPATIAAGVTQGSGELTNSVQGMVSQTGAALNGVSEASKSSLASLKAEAERAKVAVKTAEAVARESRDKVFNLSQQYASAGKENKGGLKPQLLAAKQEAKDVKDAVKDLKEAAKEKAAAVKELEKADKQATKDAGKADKAVAKEEAKAAKAAAKEEAKAAKAAAKEEAKAAKATAKEEAKAAKAAAKEDAQAAKAAAKEDAQAAKAAAKEKVQTAKEAAKEAKEIEKATMQSRRDTATDMKAALSEQAATLTELSKKYKDVAKATEELAEKLKKTYEALAGARDELTMSGLNEQQKNLFQAVKEQGETYGKQIAQVKMLASANQELSAAKNELAKAGMTEAQAKLFDLQQKYPAQVVAEIQQTQQLATQKKALTELQKGLAESKLNDKQREYLDIMRKVGVEEGQRFIQQKEMSGRQAQLLAESKKYWDTASDKAGEYFDKLQTGEMSAGKAMKGFLGDLIKEQQKTAQEATKKQFLGIFGMDKEANQNAQVQKDLDKATQFLAKSGEQVGKSSNDAAGTIAKAVADAGKQLGSSVETMGKQVNDTLKKAVELTAKADTLDAAAGKLKETASGIDIVRTRQEGKGENAETVGNSGYRASASVSAATVGNSGYRASASVPAVTSKVAKTSEAVVSANQKYVKITDEVANALSGAAKKFNYSLLELSRMASLESSFNAKVKNSSGYMGLMQFKGAASKEVGISGREYDPRAAAEGAIKYWQINQKTLDKTASGWRGTASNMGIQEGLLAWMAHNQGAGGLGQVLKTLTTGSNQMSAAVTRNVRNNMQGGAGKNLSGVELARTYMEGWIAKWNKLPLPEQFRNEFQGAVSQGVVTVTAKASQESGKAAGQAIQTQLGKMVGMNELRVKGGLHGQAFAGGKTEEGTIDLARAVQGTLGKEVNRFTAFNDSYHAGSSSGHAKGLKFDMSLANPADSAKVAEQIRELGRAAGVTVKVLDEYKNPSKRATGGHLDVGFASQADARKFAEAMRNGGSALGDFSKSVSTASKEHTQALGVVTKAATAAAKDQTQATEDQAKGFQTRLKNEQEVTNLTAVLADAKKTEQTATAGLAGDLANFATQQKQWQTVSGQTFESDINQKQLSLVNSQNYDASMKAVQSGQLQSIAQDASVVGQHAEATAQTVSDLQKGAAASVDLVKDAAAKAGDSMGEAAGNCLAKVADSPVLQDAADLKQATDEVQKNCAGKSEGLMGMFTGLKEKIGGFFGGLGESISGLLSGGQSAGGGGFLSSITNGISSLFGGSNSGGLMSTITKGIGSLFSGGSSQGGGIMSTITSGLGSLLGGGKGGSGDLLGSLGGLLGNSGGGVGKFISGLQGNLGNLTGAMGETGKAISGLLGGGGGSTPGLGMLSTGLSLLKGDMAGAASGAAQLLGSMTPLGPIGGAIAGQLFKMSGLGAKWVREAEWVNVSMKGMTAEYSKGFRETKKGWVGGGSKVGTEKLDDASIKKFNDMLGETKKSIDQVNSSLGLDQGGLIGSMGNFRYQISAMENKGQDWFDKSFEQMRIAMVKGAVDNILIAGEDIKSNLGTGLKNTFKQVLSGTFDEASRKETWSGSLEKFVSAASMAAGGLQDTASQALSDRLSDFVQNSADKIKDMPIDELTSMLSGEIGGMLNDVAGTAVPDSIAKDLAGAIASKVQEAAQIASGGESKSGLTVKGDDAGFYKTLKTMVNSFTGSEQELTAFISKMMEVKNVFKDSGLSTSVFSESLIKSFGDLDKFAASMAVFKDKFAGASGQNLELVNSLDGVNKLIGTLGKTTLPGMAVAIPTTREEFYKLTQSVSKLGKDGEATFSALVKGAPQFDAYYKAIEDFNSKFGGTTQNSLKAQAAKTASLNKEVGDAFASLGVAVPKTRKEFFDLVSGLNLADDAQRKLHDSLLQYAPALDSIFANKEQFNGFREAMAGFATTLSGPEATIAKLSQEFPNLNLGATALTINAKETAKALSTMSDEQLTSLAASLGLSGSSMDDLKQKTTEYLTASQELQTNIAGFKEKMHATATGAKDYETSLTKLEEKYPSLSATLKDTGMTVKQVATYFDSLSPTQLQELAKSLGVSVDELMKDTDTYIGALTSQSEKVKSVFGNVNASSLAGDLMKSITDENVTSASEAGKNFADNFTAQFYNQMLTTVLDGVMQTIYQGVVEPFLSSSAQAAVNIGDGASLAGANLADGASLAGANLADAGAATATNIGQAGAATAGNLGTGGQIASTAMSTGGMLAGDALAKIVEDAKQRIQVMAQVMGELNKSGAMDEIKKSFTSIGATTYTAMQNSPAADSLFSKARDKQAKDAEKADKAEEKADEKAAKEAKREADKQAKEEKQAAEKEAREAASASKKEAEEAAKAAEKTLKDFHSSLKIMQLGLEGNAKTMYDLHEMYDQTSVSQLLNINNSKDLGEALNKIPLTDLQAIAATTGQDVSKVTGDLSSLWDMVKQGEKAMGAFRDKMAVTAGVTTENEQTLERLRKQYPGLTSVFNDQSLSAKQLADQLSGMSNDQLKAMADSLGVSVETFMTDSEAYVTALGNQQKATSDFTNKMAVLSGATTENEQSMQRLRDQYPGLTSVFNNNALSAKDLAGQLAGMSGEQIKAMADSLGVTVDQFMADSETYINGLNTQSETLKAQTESLKGLRASLTDIAEPQKAGSKQQTIGDLDKEFAGLGLAAQSLSLDTKQAASALLTMPDDQLIAFAKQYGLSLDQLKDKSTSYLQAVNELQTTLGNFHDKMLQLSTGASDASVGLAKLQASYPNLADMTKGMDSKAITKYLAGLDSTQITELASRFGVSVEKFTADAETYVNNSKSVEEETKALAQGFTDFRTKMMQTATGTTDATVTLSKLKVTYGEIPEVQGMSSKDIAKYFSSLSDDALTSMAAKFNVPIEQFKTDAESLVSSTQATEEAAKTLATNTRDLRDSLAVTAGTLTDNDVALKNLTSKYPTLSSVINDSSVSVTEAVGKINSLSDNELHQLATQLGVDFDTLKGDTTSWVGIVKQHDDTIKANKKSISDFQNEMLKTAGAANDSQITLKNLTAKYPLLSEAINASGVTAKDAAKNFANVDMESVAKQMHVPLEEFITDSQSWMGAIAANDEALKASQQAASDYRDTMLKSTGTYGDSDITLKNLMNSYPALSTAMTQSGMNAKSAAGYFASLDSSSVDELAKSLGKTTEQFRTDSQSLVGVMAANEESFKGFHDNVAKISTGATDTATSLQGLASKYPSLSKEILHSGLTAQQAATQFSSMSRVDLEAMAKRLGVTVEQLQTDIGTFVGTLPTAEVFDGLRTGLKDLIAPLQGSEKTIADLSAKYPQLNTAMGGIGVNVTDAAKAIQGMTNEDMAQWAENNGIAANDAKEATLSYLQAVKELQGQIGTFKDKMHQLATGMTDNDTSLENLRKKYPALSSVMNDAGMTSKKVATYFDSMSATDIQGLAQSLGVSVETLMADTNTYIGLLDTQDQATKAAKDKVTSFHEEMNKLTTTMTDNDRTMMNLKGRYPLLTDELAKMGTTSKDVATQLQTLSPEKLDAMAKSLNMTTDDLIANASQYANTLAGQEADTKAAITSVKGMQTEFRKMTSGISDAQFTVNELTNKYPKLINSMGLSGKTANEVASQFASMSPEKVVATAKGLGVTTDEFIGDVNSYVGALKTMGDEAKAVRDSLLGFKDDMAKMGTSLSDNEFTLNSLSTKFPSLTSELSKLGTDSKSVANSLSTMDVGQLEKMAASMNLKPEEFINNSKAYVDALRARDDEIAKQTEEANTKAQEEATKAAEKSQTDLMKTVDKFFSAFDKIAEKISSVSNDIVTDMQSLDTTDETVLASRRAANMQGLQTQINSLPGYDLKEEIDKDSTKDMEKAVDNVGKYRKLLADETKYRIDQINKEKDELQKAQEKIAADFAKFVESLTSLSGTIGDDVTKLEEEIGGGLGKGAIKEKTKGEFATASATALASTAAINPIAKMGTITQTNTEALQGVSPDVVQQTSAANMAMSKAVVDSIKAAQAASNVATTDAEKAIKLAEEYHKNILAALDEQIADLNKKNEAEKKAIEDATTVKTKALEKERDDKVKALEKERDLNAKNAEATQKAAKELMDTLTKIKENVTKLKEGVGSDMESLRKEMQLPGTTASEQLAAMAEQISANMPATDDSVKTLEKYKNLVNESLKEQIDAENKKFDEVKKTQDLQRDHYKKLIDFSKQLKDTVDSLKLGDLSTYNPLKMQEEAKRQYEEVLAKAKGGDETAMGEVSGKAQEYLKIAQTNYASGDEYTKIFDEVNSNLVGMKDTADEQARKIALQVPIDETETGKNVANLLPLQQNALDKLQMVDGLLGTMDKSLTQQLLAPAATPMPDDQFTKMQDDAKQHFDDLIEKQKTNTEDLITQAKADNDKQIADSQANTDKLIIGAKEAAKAELLTLNDSITVLKDTFQKEADKTFDDTAFAGMITATQQASLAQLMQLGNYLIAMDAGLKDSLSTNINALMSQLSPENQLAVAERLDEAMQRNITGPLYELIGAVKGESVKKANVEKEKAAADNQVALTDYMNAFAAYEKEAKAQNITASFDVIASKLADAIKVTKDSSMNSGYRIDYNYEALAKAMSDVGLKNADQLQSTLSSFVAHAATQTNGAWGDFKATYLASNQQLLGMFKSDIGAPLADQLAKYRELSLVIPNIEKSISFLSTTAMNQGRSKAELFNTLDTRGEIQSVPGVDIKSYADFEKAKATFEEMKKTIMGITELTPSVTNFTGQVTKAKESLGAIPQIDFGKFNTAVNTASLFSYLPKAAGATTPVSTSGAVDTLAPAGGVAGVASASSAPTLPAIVNNSVLATGAKDIIVKLEDLSTKWRDTFKGFREIDAKDLEQRRKGDFEQQLKWREADAKDLEKRRKTDSEQQLKWQNEEVVFQASLTKLLQDDTLLLRDTFASNNIALGAVLNAGFSQVASSVGAQFQQLEMEVAVAASKANLQQEAKTETLPKFAEGTAYVPTDMTADVHQGEIIVDPASAALLRRYGITINTPAANNSPPVDTRRLEQLLAALLAAVQNNSLTTERVERAIQALEDTVGKPIRRAVERTAETRRRA